MVPICWGSKQLLNRSFQSHQIKIISILMPRTGTQDEYQKYESDWPHFR